jgi:tetratricopeptide (TPR) repeat protein
MSKKVLRGFLTFVMLVGLAAALLFAGAAEANAQPRQQLERAQRLATEGDGFVRQKNYRSAIDKYQQALSLAPIYPYAYYFKGYSHFYLGEYDQAIADFNKALEQRYNKPLDVYAMRWQAFYWRRNYDAALQDVQQALRLQPTSANFHLALGDCYRGKNDFRSALTAYQRAAQLDEANADVHYFIAFCHNQLGEIPQQGLAAIKAIEKNTRYKGESWEYVGNALVFGKKYEDAAKSYEQALIAKPDLRDVYSNLSDVYRILNRFDDAINVTRRALQRYQNDGNLYISLAWYYSLADRHQEAVNAGLQATRLLPTQHMGFTNLCRAYNDTKQYALAVQTCNKALQLSPGDGETYLYLARAYDFQKKTALATAAYKKAVDGLVAFTRNNAEYSDGFYLLGNAYYATNQRANAIAAYKRCLELAPRFDKARYNLGYIYVLMGNKALAREQYNALLQLDQALAAKLLEAINR